MTSLARAAARLLRATMLVDRAYERYCRARSLLVTAAASDAVLGAYNDVAHGATAVYDAGARSFRKSLFNWEEDMLRRVFPPPPRRVLVGGAGGGREAFQLQARGYRVVAFEPSERLARSMARRAKEGGIAIEALEGRYQQLPRLRDVESGACVDLSRVAPFDVALLGWVSYSHLRGSSARSRALASMAALTDGPVIASFYPRPVIAQGGQLRRRLNTLGRRADGDAFTPYVGYYHTSSEEEIGREVQDAGLTVVASSWAHADGEWPWVAVARPQIAARVGASLGVPD